jgi:hypothetical protein
MVPNLYSPILRASRYTYVLDVLNSAAGVATPVPGFSYFTSISTSAARHTSARKVGHLGHSCGIHMAQVRRDGAGGGNLHLPLVDRWIALARSEII